MGTKNYNKVLSYDWPSLYAFVLSICKFNFIIIFIQSINILWFLLQKKSFETSKNGNKIKDKTASEKSECLVLRNAVKNPEMISLLRDRTRNFDK